MQMDSNDTWASPTVNNIVGTEEEVKGVKEKEKKLCIYKICIDTVLFFFFIFFCLF
jgi:hypothetical protein